MTYAQVLALIQQWIVANGNNEITANVLRPILEAMLNQPNDLIGDLDNLQTGDKSNLVAAINEIISQSLALLPTKEIATTPYDITTDDLNRPLVFTSNNQVVNIPTSLVADAVAAGLTLFDFKANFQGTGTHTVNYPDSESQTFSQGALIYALCIDTSGGTVWIIKDWSLLKEITTDAYNGNRLSPLGRPHGFQVDKNGNISVGYRTSNNGTGSGALAGYIASILSDYSSSISMAFYGVNYFITELRNRGAISASNNIFYRSRGDAADVGHEFQTGATPETQVTKLKIHSDRTETSNDVVVKSDDETKGFKRQNAAGTTLVEVGIEDETIGTATVRSTTGEEVDIRQGVVNIKSNAALPAMALRTIEPFTGTEIALGNPLGLYNATPDWNATYTTASPVPGGNATLLIDTTGQTGFPAVTGATLNDSSPFAADKIYEMYVRSLDGTAVEYSFLLLRDA